MEDMIGERLEEARKRKGVSIREVAEATKIRGDYLLAMEDNTFDIPLPQIYIRGFLRNYARYLKLDPSKILTDYEAHILGRAPRPTVPSGRGQKESLGHVEIPDDSAARDETGQVVITEAPEDDGPEPEVQVNLGRKGEARPTPPPPTLDRQGTKRDMESWNENKSLYIKIGVVFAAIILVAIILTVMIQLLRGGKETPALNPDLAAASSQQPSTVVTAGGQIRADSIVLSATDNVTLIVEQTVDRKRLWSGTLNAGETLSLEKTGPVSIRFSNGAALVIEKDGQRLSTPQEGVGRTVVQ